MKQDRQTAISARAHQLWEESGHVHSQHDHHWRQAEREHDDAEARAAAVEQFSSEAVETAPAKPSRKKPAKAAASMVDTAAPAKKPRAPRKSSATTALN
ncbi:DUF2934 domain-containing protein [Lichenibacterium minor]|uniref:DUF2934 domain-containing protein n=1 Tax=Lichenibacterium minor TaxID=2316528 RepID=A0A4Q2U4D3_9HYPH|nr:DUF2934 domain-containing protein [Lichenibacterium minor]RYC29646.1 DUF2934 domain-containing protein [Lichenibacterium minor]